MKFGKKESVRKRKKNERFVIWCDFFDVYLITLPVHAYS